MVDGGNSDGNSSAEDFEISQKVTRMSPSALFASTPSSSTLIGNSTAREQLRNEIQHAYQESLLADKEKDKEEKNYRESKALQEAREKRVPPEPSLSSEHCVISHRHMNGTSTRIFPSNCHMNNVYDWAGSLNIFPMHFKLTYVDSTEAISPSDVITDHSNVVLVQRAQEDPIPLDESEIISMSGYKAKTLCNLEEKRCSISNSFKESAKVYSVSRDTIVKDVLKIYKGRHITDRNILFSFDGEDSVGDGVAKDVYSCFFNEVFKMFSLGYESNIPSALTKYDALHLGLIITHAYLLFKIFPVSLYKAFFEYCVLDSVRDSTLTESFMLYIEPKEREILNTQFSCPEDRQKVWNLFLDLGINCVQPNKETVN